MKYICLSVFLTRSRSIISERRLTVESRPSQCPSTASASFTAA